MAKRLSKGTSLLVRRAEEVRSYRNMRRITVAAMACILVLLVLIYVISIMYTKFGAFTVSVNKYHQLQYGLSLCENRDFLTPTAHLDCRASENITNIDGRTLDDLGLGAIDGEDSGENYLCYTFYLKNVGKETVNFEHAIVIANMTMGAEKAVRVRLMTNYNGENGKQVDYARAAGVDKDGNTIPEPNTVPFYDKNTVMTEEIRDFAPGDMMKYTVVVWFEGNDPECIDNIIGGEFKIDMKFSVTGVTSNSEEENK